MSLLNPEEQIREAIAVEIRQLEDAQDSRATVLGYALIRLWESVIEPDTRFLNAPSRPHAAAMFQDQKIWDLLEIVRHEVGRHARVNAWQQQKIDKLKVRLAPSV